MSTGVAMTRVLIDRHRSGLIVCGSYLTTAALTVALVGQSRMPDFVAFLIFVGMAVCGFYLATVFVHSDSDVAIAGSTYPAHYFTLPVATRDLVLWPVLAGIVVLGGGTFLLATAIQYAGFSFRATDAALFAVALLTTLQAIFWSPLGIPYSKLLLTIVAIQGLIAIAFSPTLLGFSAETKAALFLAVTAGAITLTAKGVARARMGDSWVSIHRPDEETKARSRPLKKLRPFRNAVDAQFWYEWRQQGLSLPVVTVLLLFVFFVPGLLNDTVSPLYMLRRPDSAVVPTVPTYLMTFYPLIVGLMAIYGWAVGCGAKRMDTKRDGRTFHLVFGTRPMSDEALVWTKLKVAAASTGLSWALLIGLSLPLLFTSGGYMVDNAVSGPSAPLYEVLANFLTPDACLRVFLLAVIFAFLTWRNYVIGLWAELSGILTLRYAQPMIAVAIAITVGNIDPGRPDRLPWYAGILTTLVIAKITAAIIVAYRQGKSGLVKSGSLLRVWLGFLGAVALFEGAVFFLLAPIMRDAQWSLMNETTYYWTVALLVIYLVPITRILLAVSTLSANRHR